MIPERRMDLLFQILKHGNLSIATGSGG
jgi:hypothetical protein